MNLPTLQSLLRDSFGDYPPRTQALDPAQMHAQAADLFAQHYYIPESMPDFELPQPLIWLANELGGAESQDGTDGSWWSLLMSWEGMISALDYELENYSDDREWVLSRYKQPFHFFIPIGYWSDKHTYFISCDRRFKHGAIFDCHDSYMWDLGEYDEVAADIFALLPAEFPKSANHKLK